MTEQPHEDYLPNSDSPARYDIPWIFRFSLVMVATCGLLAIFAVAFKSSSTVKVMLALNLRSRPKFCHLPLKTSPTHPKSTAKSALIKPQNQRETPTTNQRIVIPQFPGENPTSKIKHSPISHSQSPIPNSEVLTKSTQKKPVPPESIVISEVPPNPEITAESIPENTQNPTIQQQSIADELGVELTLQEVVFLGLENNRDIKNQYLERIVQKQDLAVAEGLFVPSFYTETIRLINSLRNGGRVATTGEVDLSAQVSVKIPTGGNISFVWSSKQGQDANGFGINSEGSLSQNLTLNFTQPLLRGAGVAVNRAPIEIARLSEKEIF
jgi:hypothetical protein